MAQKVQVLFVDDVDGSDAAETVSFGLDGVQYEIDVSDPHAQALRESLAPWLGHARRTGGRASRSAAKARPAPPAAEKEDLSAMRDWARENGFQVSDRGRLSREVHDAWDLRNTPVAPAPAPVEAKPAAKAKSSPAAKKRAAKIEAAFSG